MRKKRAEKVRVPNPGRARKAGRLDAPPGTAHRSKKAYQRRPKHPGRDRVAD